MMFGKKSKKHWGNIDRMEWWGGRGEDGKVLNGRNSSLAKIESLYFGGKSVVWEKIQVKLR